MKKILTLLLMLFTVIVMVQSQATFVDAASVESRQVSNWGTSSGTHATYSSITLQNFKTDAKQKFTLNDNGEYYTSVDVQAVMHTALALKAGNSIPLDNNHVVRINNFNSHLYYKTKDGNWAKVGDYPVIITPYTYIQDEQRFTVPGNLNRSDFRVTSSIELQQRKFPIGTEFKLTFSGKMTYASLNLTVQENENNNQFNLGGYPVGHFIQNANEGSLLYDQQKDVYFLNAQSLFQNTKKKGEREIYFQLKNGWNTVFTKKLSETAASKENDDQVLMEIENQELKNLTLNRKYQAVFTVRYLADQEVVSTVFDLEAKKRATLLIQNPKITYSFSNYDPKTEAHQSNLEFDMLMLSPTPLHEQNDNDINLNMHVELNQDESLFNKDVEIDLLYIGKFEEGYLYSQRAVYFPLKENNNENILIHGGQDYDLMLNLTLGETLNVSATENIITRPRIWFRHVVLEINPEEITVASVIPSKTMLVTGFEYDTENPSKLYDHLLQADDIKYGRYELNKVYLLNELLEEDFSSSAILQVDSSWEVEPIWKSEDTYLALEYKPSQIISKTFNPFQFAFKTLKKGYNTADYINDESNQMVLESKDWINENKGIELRAKLGTFYQKEQILENITLDLALQLEQDDGHTSSTIIKLNNQKTKVPINKNHTLTVMKEGTQFHHKGSENNYLVPNEPIHGEIIWTIETGVVVME